MVDIEGEEFRGKKAIAERRAKGLQKKIIGVAVEEGSSALKARDKIVHQNEVVAEVVTAHWSWVLGRAIGLALFELPFAYAGLELEGEDGRRIDTLSMPPFTANSLTVKLDEM